jgi:alcohol dehydrogenase class IV
VGLANRFDFATAGRIVFGWGKLAHAGELAASLGRRAFLVHREGADLALLTDSLAAAGVEWSTCPVRGEPDLDGVQAATQQARAGGCDCLVAFGGGSVLDTGKAIGALLTNSGDIRQYLEVVGENRPLTQSAAPLLAIPTTAGTGSEVTRNAVLAVPDQRVKVSMRSAGMLPRVALIDPQLTVSLPPEVTASTGMDALTQCLEPFVSSKANPLVDTFALEGLRRAAGALRHAYEHPADRAAREDMAYASLMGGLSLANAGLGAVHGFAGPLGGLFEAPHGALCARLLPAATLVNLEALPARQPDHPALARYDRIAQEVVGQGSGRSELVEWLERLVADLRIPPLSHWGVQPADYAAIIERAEQASSMKANPIVLNRAELRRILELAR